MPDHITVSRVIPARPERIFAAWLSPEEHTKMTGSFAHEEGGIFLAWDGYIQARTVEQKPNSRIVQTWRTTEFAAKDPDSTLVVTLTPEEKGTLVTLEHTNIPDGQGDGYLQGWNDFYFDPMERYFTSPESKLKDMSDALDEVLEKVEESIEDVGQHAVAAVKKAQKGARKQALAAVKQVKKVATKAGKAVKKEVRKLSAKKKPSPKKKVAAKKAKAPAKKKVAPKKKSRK